MSRISLYAVLVTAVVPLVAQCADRPIDFNRDVRPILSNNCYFCHGPDEKERKGGSDGLRFDTEAGVFADLGGYTAIVRGKPDDSELIKRVTHADLDLQMPPPKSGKKLSERDIETLRLWIQQGAPYARHWSYSPPVRHPLPVVKNNTWPRNGIDYFLLERLEREGLNPAPEADRFALIRRLSLDITGLPPTLAEVDAFVNDRSPDAYEQLVDRLLQKDSYGEHWARMWLDLARYADSAGYADDPPRTIWAYRDYVIRAFNRNVTFDQFTIEQIAGDLLPEPAEEQLIATAFHRNTQTNNEGGTNDEEFRNVAIVDRVNTTMAVWMGTTIDCAQCHNHKYDPISQTEFFQLFAFYNNTEDADRRDESPLLTFYSDADKRQRAALETEITQLDTTLRTPTPELLESQNRWEQAFPTDLAWIMPKPATVRSRDGTTLVVQDDFTVLASNGKPNDIYTLNLPLNLQSLTALRLDALPHDSLPGQGPGLGGGNFVVSRVLATITPPDSAKLTGRYVRVEIPGKQKILSLAEVQVFSGAENIATQGEATQSSVDYDGPAKLAIDGNTNGDYAAKSTTHTAISDEPWWELDLKKAQGIDRVMVWNRTDGNVGGRLSDFRVAILDEQRKVIWEQQIKDAPKRNLDLSTTGVRPVKFVAAFADVAQSGFEASNVLDNKDVKTKGWAVGGYVGKPHSLMLIAERPLEVVAGSTLSVTIEQLSQHAQHLLGHFRVAVTADPRAAEFAKTPANVIALLQKPKNDRTDADRAALSEYFLVQVATEQQGVRDKLAGVRKQLADLKPMTVPIQRELATTARRTTKLQYRGNFMDLGAEVQEGVPSAFHPLPEGAPRNRLTLARWLIDENNPLTARVIVNRYWEKLFGTGLVLTSEEFGSQGDLPSHPELLDWLALEFRETLKWDMKKLIKLLVTTAAYRQSSRVTPELYERDPDNRLLARGPRFRLTAEAIRDQALFVAGLLSPKLYGPPVKPPQPALGVSAAFGSGIDWQTSDGEDRYRRGIYTNWRRSNPYPSMSTFDAPNREICTLRRPRTNTPLQALVTLNDPVYIEAAQALARRMLQEGGGAETDKMTYGFRLCLARHPSEIELGRLMRLFQQAKDQFSKAPAEAANFATKPIGPGPQGVEIADLAAWTVIGNVLLNLDEMFMSR